VIEKTSGISRRIRNTTEITRELDQSSRELTDTLGKMLSTLSGIHSRMGEVSTVTSDAARSTSGTRLTIQELKSITREIAGMIAFINEIAEKTHVLSINAAIEASRASEAGGGFSVISKEVRQLSEQTTGTAREIGSRLKGIEDRVARVVESMDQITGIVEEINRLNGDILKVVEENEVYTGELRSQSRLTIQAVENVSSDVLQAVEEAEEVTDIGEQVRKGLRDLR